MGEGGFPPKTNKVLAVGGGGGIEGDGNEEETERNRPQPGSLTEGVETKTDQVFCIPLCTLCFLLFFSVGLIVEVDFLKELVAFPHCNLFFPGQCHPLLSRILVSPRLLLRRISMPLQHDRRLPSPARALECGPGMCFPPSICSAPNWDRIKTSCFWARSIFLS